MQANQVVIMLRRLRLRRGAGSDFECRRRPSREELGFTLVELLIVIFILPIVVGGVTVAVITTLNDQIGLSAKLADSSDAQFTASHFVRDVQSAELMTTSSSSPALCGSGTQLLGLEWQSSQGTTGFVSYVTTSKHTVVRNFCTMSGSITSSVKSTTVSYDMSKSIPPTMTVTPNYPPPSSSPALCPQPVNASLNISLLPTFCVANVALDITEQINKQNPIPFTFSLTASPRQESPLGGIPPTGSSPSLLTLGSGVSPGSPFVNCSGSGHGGTVTVNGVAAVDSSSSNSLNFSGGDTFTGTNVYTDMGASGPLSGTYTQTTTQPYSSGPTIPDPYMDLPDPPTIVGGVPVQQYTTTSTLPGPGIYVNPVVITQTPPPLPRGIYIFEQGFSVAGKPGGAVITSGSGGVMFFIGIPNASLNTVNTAAYNVAGNGTMNLSPMTSGIYANVVIFQSRTDFSPLAISGNGTDNTYNNGVIYAPDAQVSTSGNGTTQTDGIVAGSLSCGGNGGVTIGAPSSTTTALVSSPKPSVSGQSVTFTATVSAGQFTPLGGTVTFTDTPNGSMTPVTLCSGVSLNNGKATCGTPSLIGSGSPYTIVATYSGTVNFASSSNTSSQTVNPDTTSTAVTSSLNPSTLGQAVTYKATVGVVAPATGTAVGFVEFLDNSTPVSGCGGASGVALNAGTPDVATCTVTYTGGAIHTIQAQYLGTANFASSSATMFQSVGPTLSNFSENAVGPGQESLTGTTNENTGTVTVYLCSGTLSSCSSTSTALVQTYATTSFTGSSPSFAWSVTTNTGDLITGSSYTAQVSQVDASAQPSVNMPTVQFTAN